MPFIGIDFGTSNSVVANFQFGQAEVLPNHEGHRYTPSIVTMRRDGSLAFGQEAKETFDESRSIRSIKRILGVTPGMGKALGVDEKWVYDIVRQVGNYGEAFERNLGMGSPLKIERGMNKLWKDGGLQYAPPIR